MTTTLPIFAITHGQAVWVLSNMGFRTGDSASAFNSYIKYLRRAGLPFAKEELGVGAGHNVVYRYDHLMELAVALALRAQAILPSDITQILADLRTKLRPIYRRAYIERESGLGAPCTIRFGGKRKSRVAGVYLDLNSHVCRDGLPSACGTQSARSRRRLRAVRHSASGSTCARPVESLRSRRRCRQAGRPRTGDQAGPAIVLLPY